MAEGSRIAELRTARRMTIAGLARAASVSRPTVYAAEAGEPVGLETLVKIAAALEASLADISPEAAKAIEAVA